MLLIVHSVPCLAFTFYCFEGQLPAEVHFSQAKKLQHCNNIHPGRTGLDWARLVSTGLGMLADSLTPTSSNVFSVISGLRGVVFVVSVSETH